MERPGADIHWVTHDGRKPLHEVGGNPACDPGEENKQRQLSFLSQCLRQAFDRKRGVTVHLPITLFIAELGGAQELRLILKLSRQAVKRFAAHKVLAFSGAAINSRISESEIIGR